MMISHLRSALVQHSAKTTLLLLLMANTLPVVSNGAYAEAMAIPEQANAITLYNDGNVGDALPLFEQQVQQNPQSDTAQLWLAKAYMKQGGESGYAQAKTHLIQALTLNPDNAEALMHLGTINGWDSSRRSQAIQMLSRALELKDSSPVVTEQHNDVTKNLVQLLIWDGRYREAAEYAQPIRQAFATDIKWQAVYANLLTRLGQHGDAITLYENYIKPFEQPATPEALQWRMDYLYALRYGNQGGQAQQLFDGLYDTVMARRGTEQSDDLLNSLGGIAYELGKYDESVAASNAISSGLGQSHDVQLRNSRAYMKIQQWQPAMDLVGQVYNRHELSADEKLEFAEAIVGNNIAEQYLPQANFVHTLFSDVASSAKYRNDAAMQERIAQYQSGGNTATAEPTVAATAVPDVSGMGTRDALNTLYGAVQQAPNNTQAMDALIGYAVSHKGDDSQAALAQLASEYSQNPKVVGAYGEYLTWDEATRKQGIQHLIQAAQLDNTIEPWMDKLDEVLGWQTPTNDLKAEYDAILALDPHHPAAQTALREIAVKLPEVNTDPTPTTAVTTTNDPWTVENATIGGPSYRNAPQAYTPAEAPSNAILTPATSGKQGGVPGQYQNRQYNGSYTNWAPESAKTAANSTPPAYTPPIKPQVVQQPYTPPTSTANVGSTSGTYVAPRKSPETFDYPTNVNRSHSYASGSYNGHPVGEQYTFSSQPVASQPSTLQKPWKTSTTQTMQTRIEEAKQLTYARNYRDALEVFDDVLQVEPNNRDAQLGKAYALLWSGRKYAAKRIIDRLYDANPSDIEVVTALAEVHKYMGRPDKALDLLRDVRQQTNTMSSLPSNTIVWDFAPPTPAGDILIPCRYEQPTFSASAPTPGYTTAPIALPAIANHAQPQAPLPNADVDALNAELDALNDAIQSVQAVQQQSEKQIITLQQDVWETKQLLNNPTAKYAPDHTAAWHNTLSEYYGQTMLSYDDPSRTTGYSGPGARQELAPYLEDRISNLEDDLFDDLRPEFRVGYMFQTQDGSNNTTKTNIWGVPNQVSFSLLPQLRVRGGVVPQRYYLPSGNVNPRKNFGLMYTAGLNYKPFNRVGFDGDIGLVNFSQSDHMNVNYRAVMTIDPFDRVRVKLGSRRLTLANSLLSVAGFKANQGAFAGQRLGPANETSVFAELNLMPFTSVDVNVAYEFAGIGGKNFSNTSYKNQVYASAGYTHRFNEKHWARLGYQFLYMGFSNNTINGFFDVTNFGATQPVVSMNPTFLADPGYDFGGYFSPKSFFLNAGRLDYRGSLFDRFLEYQLGGSIGVQSYTHGNGIADSSPTSVAYSFDAAARLNFTDWLSAYGRYNFLDSGGFFQRHRFEGGLIIRPYIEALSPVFGEKMPKATNQRDHDSQFPFVYDNFEHFY